MVDFNEFNKVSTAEWKLKIQADLKGKDYESLITFTPEGIAIKPFYHFDDYKKFKLLSGQPFQIQQELYLANEKIGNKIISKALHKGADKMIINAHKNFDIDTLTDKLDFSRLIFRLDFLDAGFFIKLYHKTKGKSAILLNPVGHLIRTGNWYFNSKKDFDILREIRMETASGFPMIEVDSAHFHNAGANIVQQIAYSLSLGVEYVERLGESVASQMVFHTATGSQYFFEINKLNVLRYLWNLVLNKYQIEAPTYIRATPGLRNKSLLSPYVNMLRTTMESMSAILGGADALVNMPYDKIFKKTNSFSERIARNQLIILNEEAGFQKAKMAAQGSYFLEHTAAEMAEKSLELFKNIEKAGGIIEQLMKGKIQEKTAESAAKEQEKFDRGERVLVGVNKYINEKEEIEMPEVYPFMKKRKGKTLIPPVIARRLAEEMERKILQEKGIDL